MMALKYDSSYPQEGNINRIPPMGSKYEDDIGVGILGEKMLDADKAKWRGYDKPPKAQ